MFRMRTLIFSLFLYGLISIGEPNSVSALDSQSLDNSWTEILYRSKIVEAIKVGSKLLGPWKPLSIITPLAETCSINQTSQSFDVRLLTSKTVSTITAGIFGPDVYQFQQYSIYWKTDPLTNVTKLESRVFYFNLKYFTFENALNKDDGIVLIVFPVSTSGDCPNPMFDGLSDVIQKKIKAPGDYAKINSGLTYTWYVNFPFGSIYHTYRAVLKDENTGKPYSATVILLPMDPNTNFVSKQQFKSSFGSIGTSCDTPLMQDMAFPNIRTSKTPIETHKGIVVLKLPA